MRLRFKDLEVLDSTQSTFILGRSQLKFTLIEDKKMITKGSVIGTQKKGKPLSFSSHNIQPKEREYRRWPEKFWFLNLIYFSGHFLEPISIAHEKLWIRITPTKATSANLEAEFAVTDRISQGVTGKLICHENKILIKDVIGKSINWRKILRFYVKIYWRGHIKKEIVLHI